MAANGGSRSGVVAGDHLHQHTGLLALPNRLQRFRPRRVYHPLKAEELQSFLKVLVRNANCLARHFFTGERQHPQPGCSHFFHLAVNFPGVRDFGLAFRIDHDAAFDAEALDRPLDIEHLRFAAAWVVQGCHVLTSRFKRDRVDAGQLPDKFFWK